MAGSLLYTAHDLKTARPDITVTRIAELLGIEIDHAKRLLAEWPTQN
jgi:hypothetical protein